jgi:hypothetical protein
MKLTKERSKKSRKKNQNALSHKILKKMENLITLTLAICVEI